METPMKQEYSQLSFFNSFDDDNLKPRDYLTSDIKQISDLCWKYAVYSTDMLEGIGIGAYENGYIDESYGIWSHCPGLGYKYSAYFYVREEQYKQFLQKIQEIHIDGLQIDISDCMDWLVDQGYKEIIIYAMWDSKHKDRRRKG